MKMLKTILHSNHCPKSLAALADPRCKAKPEDIKASLEGTWDTDHLFELKQSLEHYEFLQKQAKECGQEIEKVMIQYTAVVDTSMAEFIPSKKRITKKNGVSFNIEKYAFSI